MISFDWTLLKKNFKIIIVPKREKNICWKTMFNIVKPRYKVLGYNVLRLWQWFSEQFSLPFKRKPENRFTKTVCYNQNTLYPGSTFRILRLKDSLISINSPKLFDQMNKLRASNAFTSVWTAPIFNYLQLSQEHKTFFKYTYIKCVKVNAKLTIFVQMKMKNKAWNKIFCPRCKNYTFCHIFRAPMIYLS